MKNTSICNVGLLQRAALNRPSFHSKEMASLPAIRTREKALMSLPRDHISQWKSYPRGFSSSSSATSCGASLNGLEITSGAIQCGEPVDVVHRLSVCFKCLAVKYAK